MNQFNDSGITEQDFPDIESMKKIASKWDPSNSSIKGPNDPVDICLIHVLPNISQEILNANLEETND
jgi:hypothetical protein